LGKPPDSTFVVSVQGDYPDTIAYLKTKEEVHVIVNNTNLGVAGGRADQVLYLLHNDLKPDDIVIFLDDDITAQTQNWITLLTNPIVVGQADIAGAQGGYVTPKFYTLPAPAFDTEPDYVGGGWCAVSGRVFISGVIHDTDFNPYGWEDVDLCFQAKEKGFRVQSVPETGLIHPSHMGNLEYFHQSRAVFMRKWTCSGKRR
jgi:GT2 family glycosyltransferase